MPLKKRELRDKAQKILNDLASRNLIPKNARALSMLITNDAEIRELNREYRGKDKPTDVLSFCQREPCDTSICPEELGDIVISLETAKRQAREYNCSVRQEILRLLIHGLLHLCGFEHEGVRSAEAQRMRRQEKRLLGLAL